MLLFLYLLQEEEEAELSHVAEDLSAFSDGTGIEVQDVTSLHDNTLLQVLSSKHHTFDLRSNAMKVPTSAHF
jgi:hypothetical protein